MHADPSIDAAFLGDAAWTEARRLFSAPGATGLLPIGATEAHGPHLPLHTDVYLSLEWCERIARAIPSPPTCVILPPLTLAVTEYAAGLAGTISLRPETARGLLADVLDSLGRHGLSRVALVNSHLEPRHVRLLEEAAAAPRAQPRVLFVNHCRRPWALELGDEFKSGDCHAGGYETSLLLASRFHRLVRQDAARRLPPARHGLLDKMKAGVKSFEEMGAAEGYFGDPAAASAEEGERLWSVLVRMWCDVLGER